MIDNHIRNARSLIEDALAAFTVDQPYAGGKLLNRAAGSLLHQKGLPGSFLPLLYFTGSTTKPWGVFWQNREWLYDKGENVCMDLLSWIPKED